jgi:mRNA interferase YafO
VSVFITEALAKRFKAADLDVEDFISEFSDWKAGWPANEYRFRLFGKDGLYDNPRVRGVRVLRHVHLEPFDEDRLKRWLHALKRFARKTSDRALVYTQNKQGDCLLITILDEPDAHEIARMETACHRDLMNAFAQVAQEWLDDGSITA